LALTARTGDTRDRLHPQRGVIFLLCGYQRPDQHSALVSLRRGERCPYLAQMLLGFVGGLHALVPDAGPVPVSPSSRAPPEPLSFTSLLATPSHRARLTVTASVSGRRLREPLSVTPACNGYLMPPPSPLSSAARTIARRET